MKNDYLFLCGKRRLRYLLYLCCLLSLFGAQVARAQLSSNVAISPQASPSGLTPCSGQGTFVVRVSNITASAINNLTFRDSMPPGINYVAGSVSGTGVTFGSTIIAGNVVTFNIASIPSSGFVDITFRAAANCSVSTNSANIKNTYQVNWGTNFTAPFVTATYAANFPSLSISVDSVTVTRICGNRFVRRVTVCNGGFGALDSLTVTDVESSSSLLIVNFDKGTVTGNNTSNARTVLHAADFMTVGNGDGKLDQNECITIADTQKVNGYTSPVSGTISASWGCSGTSCATGGASYSTSTIIDPATLPPPALTRVSFQQTSNDSSGQIYNRVTTYSEVIKNNSSATAANIYVNYVATGLKYIITGSVQVSKNGAAPYTPAITALGYPGPWSNPNGSMAV
jgi:uncharacterized repeat protein (TIGR01451 family)